MQKKTTSNDYTNTTKEGVMLMTPSDIVITTKNYLA